MLLLMVLPTYSNKATHLSHKHFVALTSERIKRQRPRTGDHCPVLIKLTPWTVLGAKAGWVSAYGHARKVGLGLGGLAFLVTYSE